ncbi:MAG: S-layer homology domain-containing protein [Clostridiales bacterium]|nr:S-layer homology domain-containing protein [Clostridiales bacterium]
MLSYNDALTISDYAYSALQWACSAGIIKGDNNGNLNPKNTATRAEVAAMLERFIKSVALD